MTEACAHDWVKSAEHNEEDRVFCRKCGADRFECWCGTVGTFDELFADEGLSGSCHGTGSLECYCGGDLCVCHNHGETECHGCDACAEGDEWDEYDDYEEDGPQDLEDQLESALDRSAQRR